MENTEENCKMIWKIWKKGKSNSDNIWTIWKKGKLNSEKIWKIWKKPKLNSEKIWKIQKQIVKRYGKYGGKVSWIVKRYGKYRRKLWKDMKNMEDFCVSHNYTQRDLLLRLLRPGVSHFNFVFNVRCLIVIHWFAILFEIFV